MATKLGRNEECHCGSKKKYKRCCMKNEIYNQATRLLDLEWYKVRKMEGVVINKYLYPYLKSLPYDFLEYSIKEILPKNFPEWVDMENLSYQFF